LDAQNQQSNSSPVGNFVWMSRNSKVATVSSGLVTLVGRGEVEIVCQYPRQVNASFLGATPSGTEGVQSTLQLTVLA
jgi:hypothetical protein